MRLTKLRRRDARAQATPPETCGVLVPGAPAFSSTRRSAPPAPPTAGLLWTRVSPEMPTGCWTGCVRCMAGRCSGVPSQVLNSETCFARRRRAAAPERDIGDGLPVRVLHHERLLKLADRTRARGRRRAGGGSSPYLSPSAPASTAARPRRQFRTGVNHARPKRRPTGSLPLALRQTGSACANVDGADDRIAAEPLSNQLHEIYTRQFGIQASADHGVERVS